MKRIQPSEILSKEFEEGKRTKKLSLNELILRSAQLMLQRAVEEEVQEFLGRGHYQRAGEDFRGYRNGYEPKKIRTGEGVIRIQVPQVREARERFRSHLRDGHQLRDKSRVVWKSGSPCLFLV